MTPRPRCRERGSMLLVVCVLLVVFLMTAALLAIRLTANLRLVRDFERRNQAFFVSESGLNVLSERLRVSDPHHRPERLQADGGVGGGTFEAEARRVPGPAAGPDSDPRYVLESRGAYQGRLTVLSARGVLQADGLHLEAFRYGAARESWRHPPQGGPGGGRPGR